MTNLYDGQITDLLNNGLRYNPETIAVAYAVQQEKRRIMTLAQRTRLQSAIESLDEWTLDYLAVELRTPAYRDDYPIEIKRRLIAGTLPFYAHLGTPAAVDWVINAIFTGGHIQEWFEYGGNPHHFRVTINVTGRVVQLDETATMERLIGSTKRLTSWLDEIEYIMEAKDPAYFRLGTAIGALVRFPVPQQPDKFNFKGGVHTGAGIGAKITVPIPEVKDTFHFRSGVHTGAGAGIAAKIPISAAADKFNFRKAIRTAAGAGIAATIPIPRKADKFNFKRAVRMSTEAGVSASVPIPQQPERLEMRSNTSIGGHGAIMTTTPVAETKEE